MALVHAVPTTPPAVLQKAAVKAQVADDEAAQQTDDEYLRLSVLRGQVDAILERLDTRFGLGVSKHRR